MYGSLTPTGHFEPSNARYRIPTRTEIMSNKLVERSAGDRSSEVAPHENISYVSYYGEEGDELFGAPKTGFSKSDYETDPMFSKADDEIQLKTRTNVLKNVGALDSKSTQNFKEGNATRAILANQIKRDFINLTSPITKFIARYLYYTERSSEEIPRFLLISSTYDIITKTTNWESILNALYNSADFASGVDAAELGDAVMHMISLNKKFKNLTIQDELSGKRTLILEEIQQIANTYGRSVSNFIKSHQEMSSGKISVYLDPVLREGAQSVISQINDACRYKKDKITLLEIMESDEVLTKFLKLMALDKSANGLFGFKNVFPNSLSGTYGTLADRISSGALNYQAKNYGGGMSRDRALTVVQSRPSEANMVALSREQQELFFYFSKVVKTGRNGKTFLIYSETPNEWFYESSPFKSNGFDAQMRSTKTKKGSKKIQSISEAIEARILMQSPDPNVNGFLISYQDKNGKTKYLDRKILNDSSAFDRFRFDGTTSGYEMAHK